MDREKLFEQFFNCCKQKPEQLCGQGEKNSSILIIGKESTNVTIEENLDLCDREKGCGNSRPRGKFYETWSKYQRLIEAVYREEYDKKPCDVKLVDFEKYAFTTELSSDPRRQSSYVDARPSIEKRLELFRNSEFIQSFPVVILACGGYIQNQGEGNKRQIDNTFGVEYDGDTEGKHYYSKSNWFYTHHGKSNQKLVIHTRQFSQNIMNKLIDDIAKEIRKHLKIE